MEQIRRDGVTADELASAKRRLLAQRVYDSQTVQSLADIIARDTVGMGDPDYMLHYSDKVRTVTAAEVQAVAQRFLVPQRLITLTLMPPRFGLRIKPLTRPAEEAHAGNTPREPVELDNTVLIEKIRTALAMRGETAPALTIGPVEMRTLPNGLRMLVQRSTLMPEVAIQFYQLGGLLTDQPGQEGIANAVQTMVGKGTRTRSAAQIDHELESLGANLNYDCGNNSSLAQADCLKEDWDKVLSLMADTITDPQFPDAEWAKIQPRLLDGIERQNNRWIGELRRDFRATYFGAHPWCETSLGKAEVVAKLKPADLREFYQKHVGASGSVLAIFSDVDPEAVFTRAGQVFQALPPKPLIDLTPLVPAVKEVAGGAIQD